MPQSNDGCSALPDAELALTPKQVLVIEDNPLNLKLIGAIIAAQGYTVLEATTGLLGLELARRHHPAVIVTDIRLPDISGLEVTRILKADVDTADIMIIGTSAHAAACDGATQEAGCDAFMPKPILISNFLRVLHSLVNRRDAAIKSQDRDTAINRREPVA
jgi:two-component system, cell cycle response regulator DivK